MVTYLVDKMHSQHFTHMEHYCYKFQGNSFRIKKIGYHCERILLLLSQDEHFPHSVLCKVMKNARLYAAL